MAIKLILGAAILGGVSVLVGANLQRELPSLDFKWKLQREVPIEILLEPAKKSNVLHVVSAPGEVEADIEVDISAQVLGRIVELPVKEGDVVKKGDLLVKIDAVAFEAAVREFEAQVTQLKAQIESSKHDLDKAKRDFENDQELLKRKAIGKDQAANTETIFKRMQSQLVAATANVLAMEHRLSKAKKDLRDATIYSPIDGVVSKCDAEIGETVVVGTMNIAGSIIMSVSDMNHIVVRARVDETDAPLVKPGQKATIHLQYDEKHPLTGKVLRISPKGTKGSGSLGASSSNANDVATFETVVAIENPPPRCRLGMTANVDIQVDERTNVLTVPAQSVLHRKSKEIPRQLLDQAMQDAPQRAGGMDAAKRYLQVVFVEDAGLARCRLVTTGVSDEGRVEILSGVHEGEKIVSGPYRIFDKLKDGRAVAEMKDDEPVIPTKKADG
jgi:HlyD family secretion protein